MKVKFFTPLINYIQDVAAEEVSLRVRPEQLRDKAPIRSLFEFGFPYSQSFIGGDEIPD